jgi:hypothetical protein
MKPATICGKVLIVFGVGIWFSTNVAVADNLYVGYWTGGSSSMDNLIKITPSGTQSTIGTFNSIAGIASPVPEPSTLALLGIGVISLLAYAWRQRQRTT